MSEITNRKRLNPDATPFKKFLFAISWLPYFIPTPIWLIYLGLRLKPVKFKWVLMGIAALAVEIVGMTCAINETLETGSTTMMMYLPSILLVIYVFTTRVYEEYVMRYNALVDSGYFVEQERIRVANLQRWEDETASDAWNQAQSLTYQPKGEAVPRPAAIATEVIEAEEPQEVIALEESESAPPANEPETPNKDKDHPSPVGRKLDL